MQKIFYTTIAEKFVYEIPKIKGSRFFGTAFPVEDKEQVDLQVAEMRKEFYDATHHCYAYRAGIHVHEDLFGNMLIDPQFKRAHDDGEPTNTAGKPILSVLEGSQIQNILLVVTRYFGGTLLGVGGLIQAYTEAAKATILHAPLIQEEIFDELEVKYLYDQTSLLSYLFEKYEVRIMSDDYADQLKQKLQINRGWSEAFRKELFEKSNGSVVC